MMNMKLYFSNLEDPRQKAKTQHDLIEIIAMTIIAVAGDCDGWDEIEDFCTENEEWLRNKVGLKLEYGIPSADTFARVWSKLDSKEFKKSFMRWAGSIRKKIKGEVVSIDGKTSRGSEDEEHNAIHMVSAWLHDQRIVLGQIAVPEKTNEITAVPDLVKMLEIEDCIVTADAMSCQKEIVEEYFKEGTLQYIVNQPFDVTGTAGQFDIKVTLVGGGTKGQAEAVRLGIARALCEVDAEAYRPALKAAGFLTRDAREVERKKPGQPGARRRFQFSKR